MAIIGDFDQKGWDEWVATRPECVQLLAKKLPPNRLYRLSPSGSRVTLLSYSEDNTVTVAITGQFNALIFDRQVFGISPDDLKECDLPGSDEVLGALLTDPADIQSHIDNMPPPITH